MTTYGTGTQEQLRANREDRKRRAREGSPDVPHGTPAGYVGWGCHCPDCIAAKHAYDRDVRGRSGRNPVSATGKFRRDAATPKAVAEWILDRSVRSANGCLLYTHRISQYGYGMAPMTHESRLAHRIVYESVHGPIPTGLQIDHVWNRGCRHRHCVEIDHLEAVTPQENNLRSMSRSAKNARKDVCDRGHAFTDENTIRRPSEGGKRRCRECERLKERSRYAVQPRGGSFHKAKVAGRRAS